MTKYTKHTIKQYHPNEKAETTFLMTANISLFGPLKSELSDLLGKGYTKINGDQYYCVYTRLATDILEFNLELDIQYEQNRTGIFHRQRQESNNINKKMTNNVRKFFWTTVDNAKPHTTPFEEKHLNIIILTSRSPEEFQQICEQYFKETAMADIVIANQKGAGEFVGPIGNSVHTTWHAESADDMDVVCSVANLMTKVIMDNAALLHEKWIEHRYQSLIGVCEEQAINELREGADQYFSKCRFVCQ
ncbi:MAG: hypothetical protein SFW66_02040 [Gammaproteobacteria bacterium]|nr:hypothetical protein [Gammaproteobacteria bacterium]